MDLRRFEEMDTATGVLSGKGPHVHEDSLDDTTVSTMYQDTE